MIFQEELVAEVRQRTPITGHSPPPPPTFFGWLKMYYYFYYLPSHIHHLQKQITLNSNKYIKVFTDKPDNFSRFAVSFAAELTKDFNRESMEFQLLSPFSFVLGSAGV